jgi:hypothetical protein
VVVMVHMRRDYLMWPPLLYLNLQPYRRVKP